MSQQDKLNESVRPLAVSLRQLLAFCRPYWRWMLLCALLGWVRIAASLSFVWLSKWLIDIATGADDAPFVPAVCLTVCALLLQIGCGMLSSYLEGRMTVKVQQQLRLDLFARTLGAVWSGRERRHSGDTVNRLQEDTRVLTELICTRIPDMFVTLCQLLAASVMFFLFSPQLLWILVAVMLFCALASRFFFRAIRSLTAEIRSQDAEIQGYMQERVMNRMLVLTFSGIKSAAAHLGLLQKNSARRIVTRLNYNTAARGFLSFGFSVAYLIAFIWGVAGIRQGTVTYGLMTAFLQLVGQIQMPAVQLGRHVTAFVHALTSVDRVAELQAAEQEPQPAPQLLQGIAGVSADHVTYMYPDGRRTVIRDFTFDFAPGTLTVVMGPTGAGKSTLVRLILALMRPQEGSVTLYTGRERLPVSPATRCNFMYVPQGNSLMSGTVRENFLLADPQASEEDMVRALHHAMAGFVLDHPDGLDLRCGERGSGLSEGQSQRVAIARALLHTGSVLLLDEATSALDPDTERQVLDNLHQYYAGRKTIIFISHRQAVSGMSDRTVRLERTN